MKKRFVYRVDDMGYSELYDLGCYKAFEDGVGCSGDVMLDAPHVKETLKWLKERPWISVGWHRHLWESPVLGKEVPSMCDEEGRFKWRHNNPKLMLEVTYEDAYREFEAEAKLCYEYLGRYPDVASFNRGNSPLEKAYVDVLNKYDIPHDIWGTKCFLDVPMKFKDEPSEKYKDLHYYSVLPFVKTGYDLNYFNEYKPLEVMEKLYWSDEEEIYMQGWHPGYLDLHILKESSCNFHRIKELEACCSQEYKDWLIDNKVELLNQKDVLYGTHEFQDHLKEINSPLWIGNY